MMELIVKKNSYLRKKYMQISFLHCHSVKYPVKNPVKNPVKYPVKYHFAWNM